MKPMHGTGKHYPTMIIGAGQAGLAAGYYLQKHETEFRILTGDQQIGDPWRNRWDSLRLFTPTFYNSLPGLEFPGEHPEYLPFKDEVAEYLISYAETFALPVQLETRVTAIDSDDPVFVLQTSRGTFTTDNLIVATGAFSHPDLPGFHNALPREVYQCHSSEYTNPDQLVPGDVLVVGAGNSGTQISTEITLSSGNSRTVWLSGRDTGRIPRRLLGRDIYRWLLPTLGRINTDSWLGSRLRDKARSSGDPVFAPVHQAMLDAGVQRIGRTVGVESGQPVIEDLGAIEVTNVIWCTGFRPEFPWIHLDIFHRDGYPRHQNGVVEEVPGLYFLGLPFLSHIGSSLIGGVGKDAQYVTNHLVTRE